MAGTWSSLAHPPTFNASTMFLLTDGAVMCQESGGVNWWRLTPDQFGSYINGTWSPLAPMHHTRLYYASAVLKDGRVFVAGGEYSNAGSETNTAEIYDPVYDQWTEIAAPAGFAEIGDAPCCVLPDGRLLLGSINDTRTAIYDPVTNTWASGPNKDDRSAEESWVLLPDETVLTVECTNHPSAEKYVAAANTWVSAGTVPVELVESSSIEIGPAFLLPDGTVFTVGATPQTALYTPPPIANQPGTWVAGPCFPNDSNGRTLGAKDAPGCLLPNGKVLCVAGPVDGVKGDYIPPTYFFEFDGTGLTRVPDPPNSGSVPYTGRMLLTPTGHVLFAAGTPEISVYTPDGSPDPAWKPHITTYPAVIRPLSIHALQGRQINGLSQAVGYGDDAAAATNYPLVRIRHLASGNVCYCRTFDHSTMGVATGTSLQLTNFAVPFFIPSGASELCVIANGIASDCISVMVSPFWWPFPFDEVLVGILIGSLADGPLWILGPHGPIPVDPWGPRVATEARQARRQIIHGVKQLQKLGREVTRLQFKAGNATAPAVDPELESITRANGNKQASKSKRRRPRQK